jgi:hypothetical protein
LIQFEYKLLEKAEYLNKRDMKFLQILARYLKKSSFWIVILGCTIGKINLSYSAWKGTETRVIVSDVVSYYAYLPATFIHHDLKLNFINNDNKSYYANNFMFWPLTAPNGGKVIKTTMGLSFCYLPFFLLSHAYSHFVLHINPTGFEDHYELGLVCSCFVFFMIGIVYLRKILKHFVFSETVIVLTLFAFALGSNILNYSTYEAATSHVYLFGLSTALIYHIIKWHKNNQFRTLIFIGLLLGFMTLIRPTSILYALFFIFYNVNSTESFKRKIQLFRISFFKLLVIPLLGFICLLPQFIYWKVSTGQYMFNSYVGENFYFDYPMIIPGLLSYRKGWLLYSPVFVFTLIGIFQMLFKKDKQALSTFITFLIVLYIIFSWQSWYYGGGFSARALIDFYAMLIVPTAYFVQTIIEKKMILKITFLSLFSLSIVFGTLKNYQYRKGLVHYSCMNRHTYWKTFLTTKMPHDFYEKLTCPNEDRTINGEEEYYFNPRRVD